VIGSPRLLLVAPDPKFRVLLSDFLEFHGFTVFSFESSKLALHEISKYQATLILFDFFNPASDGQVFLESIRRILPTTPIVLMTAARPPDESSSALYGADHIFVKPFDLEDFVAAIHALIRRKSKEQKPP
jgi:DNA-binding response OmpR family regulator